MEPNYFVVVRKKDGTLMTLIEMFGNKGWSSKVLLIANHKPATIFAYRNWAYNAIRRTVSHNFQEVGELYIREVKFGS